MGRELARAFLIGAMREADEEVVAGLADVAAVDGSWGFNGFWFGKKWEDGRADGFDFTFATGSAGAGEDGAMGGEDGGVFDEGGVGMAEVGVEGGEGKSAFDEGLAVGGVLGENLVKVGAAERDGGQAGVEVGSGDADNGFGEQAGGPLVA